MKKLFFTLAYMLICLSVFAQGLVFTKAGNWEAVLSEAKASNKYIFIDGHATWCKPCKLMDSEIFPNAEVGTLMNDQFVSLKVQTDQVSSDDAWTKGWYADAAMLTKEYNLKVLPAQVILSSNGELLYQGFGYQGVQKFIGLIKFATDPKTVNFRDQLASYKKGDKDYSTLPELIKMVNMVLQDDELVIKMTRDYLTNYLNKQPEPAKILTKPNFDFLSGANKGLRSTDKFFILLRKLGSKASNLDSVPEAWNTSLVQSVITREELEEKLWKNGKVINANPNWNSFIAKIKTKYPEFDAGLVVEDYCRGSFENPGFYKRIGNFRMMDKYYGKQVDRLLSSGEAVDLTHGINNIAWFDYFLRVNDPLSLEQASKWVGKAIAAGIRRDDIGLGDKTNWYDTKAHVLYKAGKREGAIATLEDGIKLIQKVNIQKGLDAEKGTEGFKETIAKMKAGEKLYQNDGVVYNWK